MAFQDLIVTKDEGISTIAFNRPEKKNALTYRIMKELLIALDDAEKDSDIRVVVLTGAGDSFSAGADFKFADLKAGRLGLQQIEDLWVETKKEGLPPGKLLTIVHEVIYALMHLQKPVVAMINGDAVGGGIGLSLACDLRVGARSARFMIGYPRIGFVPDMGEAWMLPRVIGMGRAMELVMLPEFISAEEAYRVGLLNRLVPLEELENETRKVARSLMKVPPITLRMIKQQMYSALETDPRSSLQFSMACVQLVMGSKDYEEAMLGFAERRAPVYKDTPLFD